MRLVVISRIVLAGAAVAACLAMAPAQLSGVGPTGSGSGAAGLNRIGGGTQVGTDSAFTRADRPDVFARAGAARHALGFPTGSRSDGRHVHDARGSDYDEVTEIDSAGRALALTQFAGDGHLLAAVRFDLPSGTAGKATGQTAAQSALRGLTASGISVAGQARTEADPVSGGWQVRWSRSLGGFAVRGDETRVHVWSDGRIQSVAHVQHELATAPGTVLSRTAAADVVAGQCDKWFVDDTSGCQLQGMDVEWVGPNATFDATQLGNSETPYRLAWVANVKPTGTMSELVRLITFYVDAEDGKIIGGDVVE